MSANTLGTYERGITEPDSTLFATYHRRFGINLNWLIAESGEVFGVAGDASAVQIPLLADAIAVVEQWLDENRRSMAPADKAGVIAQLYDVLLEDMRGGHAPIDRRRAHQFLRLVVNNREGT